MEVITSPYAAPRQSTIHGQGVFTTKFVPKDTLIIQYVGEKISKEEANERGWKLAEETEGTDDPSVYLFVLNDDYDIDGNLPHNTARLINHSCHPNCEAHVIEDEIWIVALDDLDEGTELTFDYGFDIEHYEEHPCRCGHPSCIGYIVSRDQWPELFKRLEKKNQQRAKRKR